VTVLETKAITTYGSIRKAAEALNSDIKAILYNEKTQKPFKGRYILHNFAAAPSPLV
jgi:hypothetical protein